jgi:3-oxoacyl-[acyl-carrier protein] reductase
MSLLNISQEGYHVKLYGKVAIVTGSGEGIGKAIALRLAEDGADIVVDDIDFEKAQHVAALIKAIGRRALAVKADVTKSREVDEMFKTALRDLGKVDILVNNAGGHYQNEVMEFRYSKEETWDRIITRNLKGTLICTRAVINHMIDRGSGKIVSIASIAAVHSTPRVDDFAAAKAGVNGFTRALASEVGKHGITVNSIVPGLIGSPHVLATSPEELPSDLMKSRIIKRLGKPEDIAGAVSFLVSDDADYITGQVLVVDGGTAI